MPNILAIDIALIPQSPLLEKLVDFSNGIESAQGEPKLGLSIDGKLPHVSVGMAFISEADLPTLIQKFSGRSLAIQPTGFRELKREFGSTQYIDLELDSNLKRLHAEVMKSLREIRQVAGSQSFTEGVSERTANYVANFEDYAGANYHPHITLGYGELFEEFDLEKMDCEIAIFQLGNHCTCHRRLSPRS